ncbi:unnamed protein product [Trichobilharzia regenti]|uniref:Flagellar biosynthesis protein FlhF n=1 Tax=Trichobilharzia regenti TaxID=157069 RepID=A0A183VWE2_TRIRE|nr:unnamed protein product [Trichobilharzia regenti]VDQ00678.1 unnamed protein product [Trichobilharzia regenti]
MPISPSSMPYPTRLSSEPSKDLIEKVSRRLSTTGEIARLTAYIPGRLSELNWCESVLELCREYVRNNTASGLQAGGIQSIEKPEPSAIPIDDIVKAVTPQSRLRLPEELYTELVNRIIGFIGEQLID